MRAETDRQKLKASSLITTLLVIVVLSTIVVAFMRSMSIERAISRSFLSKEQAKLAAEAGLNMAAEQIQSAVGTNQAYLVGQTNDAGGFGPVTVIGYRNLTNLSQMVPLISGNMTLLSGYPTNAATTNIQRFLDARNDSAAGKTVNLNRNNSLITATNNPNAFRAPWVYVTGVGGETNARYAYIILDECSRLNPRFHGAGLPRNNPTNWFPGSGVMPLSTGGTNLLETNQVAAARALGTNALGLHAMGQVFASADLYNKKKHLLSTDETWGPDYIPASLPEGGRPKYNVNDLATNASFGSTPELRAEKIAAIISSNLPGFQLRDPSLRTNSSSDQQRYLKRLAAGIVDYIDSDSSVTTANGGEPAGRDLFPLVTAIGERFRKVAQTSTSTTIESQAFVQVWNPYTTTISAGTTVRIVIKNRMRVNFGTGIVRTFANYDQATNTSMTIRPGEFVVLEFPTASQTFTSLQATTSSPNWGASPTETVDTITHVPFEFYWNGGLVDMSRRDPVAPGEANAGMVRNGKTLSSNGEHYQVSFICSYNGTGANATLWRFAGDPRGNYLSNYDWGGTISSDTSYANNTRWNGIQTQTQYRWQHYGTTWAARDFVPSDFVSGRSPGSINVKPSAVPSDYVESSEGPKAIGVIANRAMTSIGELGHIYDPAQADDFGNPYTGGVGANNSPFTSGGGRTLRIGQPEFNYTNNPANNWTNNGRRAVELIDLFTVNRTNANVTNAPAARGRININTAPAEVLEALLYGISPTSDRRFTNSVITTNAIALIVRDIITNRPYSKLSDLQRITPALVNATNYSPLLNSNTAQGVAAVADRAREESFAKMIELCTVQSRAFRIFVIGESLNPKTLKPGSQAVLEGIIRVSPLLTPEVVEKRWEN